MSDELTAIEQSGSAGFEALGAGEPIAAAQEEVVEAANPAQSTKSGSVEGSANKPTSILAGEEGKESVGENEEGATEDTKPELRAPAEYVDFAVPEGMKLEGQELTDFKSFAREQDLTQEQAQRVLDFAGPKIKAMIEQPYKAWKEQTEQWWNQTKSDPEVGGTRLEQSVKDAQQAFVPNESNPFFKTQAEVQAIREALKVTGAMHHPEVQRLFVRMGKLFAEPGHLVGKPVPQDKQQTFLNSMYPTMNSV